MDRKRSGTLRPLPARRPRRVGVVLASLLALSAAGISTGAQAQESLLPSLETAARRQRRDADAQEAYGKALLRAGHYREARRVLERAARLRRNTPAALYLVAQVAFAEGEYRRARRACEPLEREDEDGVLTRVCRARAFLVWNRSARAFEELDAALATDANHYEALLALGDAHRLRAAVSEAEDAYRRAMRARPEAAAPYVGLGLLKRAAGDRAAAERALRTAVEKDPQDPDALLALGTLLGGARAVEMLERAVAVRPNVAQAQAALGDAELAAGDAQAAVTAYEKALALDANLAAAHAGLGRAHMALGAHDAAEASLKKALELVPNDAAARLALGALYERTNRPEEALELYRSAADVNPRDPTGLVRAASLSIKLRRAVLAAGYLDRLLEQHANLATGLLLYGHAARAQEHWDDARGYYQRALRGRGSIDREGIQRSIRELATEERAAAERRRGRPDPRDPATWYYPD